MVAETQSGPPAQAAAVEALLRAGVRLLDGTSASSRLDAELLLAFTLGWTRTALFARREVTVEAAAAGRYLTALHARRGGRPVAQIIGWREFWSLEFEVTPDVLTPRPETELLVEMALRRLPAGGRVLDLGTGTGAVALAVASERPEAGILATDRSAAALAIARRNAARLGLERVRFAAGDWFAAAGDGLFDVVVSNPPYVADGELAAAGPELAFEPREALAAGPDGLDAIRHIVAAAGDHLAPGGWLLLEHGATQGEATRGLLAAAGFGHVTTSRDLAGLPRVTEGQRRTSRMHSTSTTTEERTCPIDS